MFVRTRFLVDPKDIIHLKMKYNRNVKLQGVRYNERIFLFLEYFNPVFTSLKASSHKLFVLR